MIPDAFLAWTKKYTKEMLKGTNGYDKFEEYQELFEEFDEAVTIKNMIDAGFTVGINDVDFETAHMVVEISAQLARAKPDGGANKVRPRSVKGRAK